MSERQAPLCQELSQANAPTTPGELSDSIIAGLTDVISGSNAIEVVGGAIGITDRLCRQVFAGHIPNVEDIDERSDEYTQELEQLSTSGRATDLQSILRSRHEIVQHALAAKYLLETIVLQDTSLDEDIVKKTHQILMRFSEHEASEAYTESLTRQQATDCASKQTKNTKNLSKTASGSNRTDLSERGSKSRSSHPNSFVANPSSFL